MKLSCVLVACNENTHYLDFWPVVKEAWWKVVGVPCVMIYVGDFLPEHLKNDPSVIFFRAIHQWPTATQAQMIRLLYPALLKCDGAVMISDMDMIPLQKNFFLKGFEQFNDNQFVSLRGIDEQERQIYMCYVGATPTMWRELFDIHSVTDVGNRLIQFSMKYPSNGRHGGQGWCSDQLELYNKIKITQEIYPETIGLVPWTKEISRIDRVRQEDYDAQKEVINDALNKKQIVDYHMPSFHQNSAVIYSILEKCWNPSFTMHS